MAAWQRGSVAATAVAAAFVWRPRRARMHTQAPSQRTSQRIQTRPCATQRHRKALETWSVFFAPCPPEPRGWAEKRALRSGDFLLFQLHGACAKRLAQRGAQTLLTWEPICWAGGCRVACCGLGDATWCVCAGSQCLHARRRGLRARAPASVNLLGPAECKWAPASLCFAVAAQRQVAGKEI